MALDLRRLKPAELVQLVNGTPVGPALTLAELARQRRAAGAKIGDGRTVHFLRYLAWLVLERGALDESLRSETALDGYSAHKERARDRQARISREGRDLGEIPPVKQPARRAACERNLELFLLTYFPHLFYLGFSDDHRDVIRGAERAELEGGLSAYAMMRGGGKTTIAECSCIHANVYGHRRYVALLGATAGAAAECLESIKTEYETNELLAEDFPEVCFPIQALDGIVNRCKGQHLAGVRTRIQWTQKRIVLPTIAGSKASGCVLQVAGLTGRIRGMKFKRVGEDGVAETIRPDFVLPDDPQTRQSAESETQCQKRERILAGDVLGLAGPGKKIAGLMPCTVIRKGDMADRILDREKHPEWNGQRLQALKAWPVNRELWDRYAELWADGQRRGEGIVAATGFYAENRSAMDEGARVAWPQRFNPDELSGLQNLMNLKLQDEPAFLAEFQQEPQSGADEDLEALTADEIAGRFNRLARGVMPLAATRLVASIDVQGELLYYTVLAAAKDFTAWVLDYGAFPDQQRRYFSLRDARPTLRDVTKHAELPGRLYAGLQLLTAELLGRDWRREGGGFARVERCLIDANWGKSTETVYSFCRQSPHAALLLAGRGKFYGPNVTPLSMYREQPGEQLGLNWLIAQSRKRLARQVTFDSSWWKTMLMDRLRVAVGDKGALTLFGDNADVHRLYADHLTAEKRGELTGSSGRKVDQWTQIPGRDNHWLDTSSMALVAASTVGCELFADPAAPAARKWSEIQAEKRATRRAPDERWRRPLR